MLPDEQCTYVGMTRETFPICTEGGVDNDIQNDTDPGACALNKKRDDCYHGDDRFDYISYSHINYQLWIYPFECTTALHKAHGGKECQPITQVNVYMWLQWKILGK
ncbi:uncharacterized protein LOC142344964 [Convolutriloba macropyga]|uniref:uncharacterized protein LOC142344964 n=1 Tax=Convolutriloba macropyga TaxID=536237 RepID=UPI003F51EDDA